MKASYFGGFCFDNEGNICYIREMDRTVADFAKSIGVSRKTVYEWIKTNSLPPDVSYYVHLTRLIIKDERRKNKRARQGKSS